MNTFTRCHNDIRSFFAEWKCTLFSRATLHIYPAYGNWLKFAQDPNTFSLLYAKVVRALHSSSGKVVWYTILYCGCHWQAQSNILSEQLFWSRVHFFFPPHTLFQHRCKPLTTYFDLYQPSLEVTWNKDRKIWAFDRLLYKYLGTKLLEKCFYGHRMGLTNMIWLKDPWNPYIRMVWQEPS